ncbi:hypothetical protein BOX15_Mlig021312g1 [Macrostomum lignano]|uniref:Myeloid leukemia factor n=2 Tax=Macrostomum lignano TaxID=282301 RepID=A0A267GK64_9PLAT|nr:hypothetical protein BOX15_Mlig021312g1 [Macrostomum lignano]
MFSSAFREFESDPFFDFGNSPFRRQRRGHAMLEDRGARDYRSGEDYPTRQVRQRPDAAAFDDEHGGTKSRQLERYDHGSRQQRQVAERRPERGAGDDFAMSPYSSMFGGFASFERQFNQMMNGMQRMMADMGDRMRQMEEAASRDDFDGHMYSHASVYSRQYDGEKGEPHVYQAMSETRSGPGGVRETRRAVRDTRAQEERAAHGRHIGARGHVVERRRNMGTGDQHEDHRYSGISEGEVDSFDREWHGRATALMAADDDAAAGGRRRRHALERPQAEQPSRSRRAITAADREDDRAERRGGKL